MSLSPTVLHCAAFAENVAGLSMLLSPPASVHPDLSDAFDGRPLLVDIARMIAGEARTAVVETMLKSGAELAWLDTTTGEARSCFNVIAASEGEGLSADVMRFVDKERQRKSSQEQRDA